MNGIRQNREVTFQQLMPLFRIKLSRKLHRALNVREQHRDLFPLAFERGLRLQYLIDQMFGRVGARCANEGRRRLGWDNRRRIGRDTRESRATSVTETRTHRRQCTAVRASQFEFRAAPVAER